MVDWLDPVEGYSFVEQAAAEARLASRRYWAKGGPADRRYPVADDVEKMWPLGGGEPEMVPVEPLKRTRKWMRAGGE